MTNSSSSGLIVADFSRSKINRRKLAAQLTMTTRSAISALPDWTRNGVGSRFASSRTPRAVPNSCVQLQRRGSPDFVDCAKGGISNWRDFPCVAVVVRSMLASVRAPGRRRRRSWPKSPLRSSSLRSCSAARDHERRRLSEGTDAKSGGPANSPSADADGAHRRPQMRKEVGLADDRLSKRSDFSIDRPPGARRIPFTLAKPNR
jgi:hypothetical protein